MEIKLTNRELDVMNILWGADHALTAKDIANDKCALSINTVQAILKKLLKKGYIKIAEIVYSGTVLTRSYNAVLTIDEYTISQITNKVNIPTENIMVALLKREENEQEVIEKLDAILKQYRKEIEKE